MPTISNSPLPVPSTITPTQHLKRWLEQTAPPWRIGQVVLVPATDPAAASEAQVRKGGSVWLLHHLDLETYAVGAAAVDGGAASHLRRLAGMEEFREWLRWDAEGKFRPLRAAPTVRPGWLLGPLEFADLVVALRFLYPGAVADWAAYRAGTLPVTPYEESAGRQTGRFSVVRKLGAERLSELLHDCCAAGCSRTPMWAAVSQTARPENGEIAEVEASRIPLLCPEACNYFISKAREKILGRVD